MPPRRNRARRGATIAAILPRAIRHIVTAVKDGPTLAGFVAAACFSAAARHALKEGMRRQGLTVPTAAGVIEAIGAA